MILEGNRIILRRFKEDDLNDFYNYAKDESIGPNAGWKPHESIDESKEILNNFIKSEEVWAIHHKSDNKVIGSIGLHQDDKRKNINVRMVGYVLAKPYHNQGITTEAVKVIMDYAFNVLKVDLLSVYHFPFNLASKRVIEKCGFKFEGIIRKASKIYDSTIHDDVCYSLLKEEYFELIKTPNNY